MRSTGVTSVGLLLLAWLIVVVAATPARAEEPAAERVERLETELTELRQQVEELREEAPGASRLAELERKLEVLAAEIENLELGEAAPPAAVGERFSGLAPAASKVYRSESGLSIGGYGEALLEMFASSRDDGSPSDATDTFDLLRGIVYVGYKFNDAFVFNSEIEFEHASTSKSGSASVEFAYVDWLWRPELNVRAGLLLVPMGFLNELHEPTTFLGAKRPEVESRIIPSTWRENGVGIHGAAGGFDYRSYVVNGLDASGFSASGLRGGRQKGSKAKAEDFAWVGRLDWVGTPGLTVGLSAYIGDSGQDLEDAAGQSLGVGTTIWEVHADWRVRGLRLRGLWAGAELDDVAALNQALETTSSIGESLDGGYLEVGYDVLNRRSGRASLSPFVRFETIDTQAEVPTGAERSGATDREILTLGLAYQPIQELILKLDWQDVDAGDGRGVDQFNVALGYIF